MPDKQHLAQLGRGVDAWNAWWKVHPNTAPDLHSAELEKAVLSGVNLRRADLREADLHRADLREADLHRADLREADLHRADLHKARLCGADLSRANLSGADLGGASLSGAKLREAKLSEADLSGADLSGVDLHGARLGGANLQSTILVRTNFENADLTGCRVYGILAWDLKLKETVQRDLVITPLGQPQITVDNLAVSQFIYLLLHDEKIRDVIDTITSKVVLILGCFTPGRKAVLDALRQELRNHDYLPMLFDFAPSASRDITETISLLARMARFVVADITEARSIPQELSVIVPDLPSVPVQPLLQEGAGEYGMFEHFRRYPWVLEMYRYPSTEHLIATLSERVIGPAEAKVRELRG